MRFQRRASAQRGALSEWQRRRGVPTYVRTYETRREMKNARENITRARERAEGPGGKKGINDRALY